MIGNKVYFQPRNYVLAAIHDIKELQNGKGTFSDTASGKINFSIKYYNTKYELMFTVTEIGENRCQVEIGINGEVKDKDKKILREYALLDSVLLDNTQVELVKKE